jgi:hypothetical protein
MSGVHVVYRYTVVLVRILESGSGIGSVMLGAIYLFYRLCGVMWCGVAWRGVCIVLVRCAG